MSRIGLCGPSYASQSLNANAQKCENFILERDESGSGKSDWQLLPTPGLANAYQLPDFPTRGDVTINGRAFVVAGASLCELIQGAGVGTVANGGVIIRGPIANDGKLVSIAFSPTQILIASDQIGHVFDLRTNLISIPANLVNPIAVGYCNGFFLALQANSQLFQFSSPLDATAWDPLDTNEIEVFPDYAIGMIVDHNEVWFCGPTKSAVYSLTGSESVFDPVSGGIIEQGIGAAATLTRLDNSIFWWGASELGSMVAWRAQGYAPGRVSNHAIETAVQGYATASDAVSYGYQEGGHSFWVTYFPSANAGRGATWVYDVAVQQWHERSFRDAGTGLVYAHRSWCHMFAFGKHLVGDWNSGNIYQMANPKSDGAGGWLFSDDFGNAIRRIRRSPYVGTAGVFNYFKSLEFEIEAGLGPNIPLTDGSGNSRSPQIVLRWSDDGGHNFGNDRVLDIGKIGEFSRRIKAWRLGRCWGTRGRVFELSYSDPTPLRIIDADLEADPDMTPQKRIAAQLRERA